jgi:acyl transferase domain-containing protein/phosphopantetheinyl transferase (holo-ACP synthase)
MSTSLDIAVIGLAGVYPGARDAATFWQNICAKVDAVTDADPDWVGPYFEAGTQADDRIYTTKGGFLRELAQVDPIEVGLMPSVAAASDPDHLITLKVARQALDDAGYLKRKFDGSRTGVVIARGTYGNRGLASMLSRGFFMDQMMDVVRQLRPDFSASDIRELQSDLKKQLPPYGGDAVGVLTPNVIASLVANRLDLMGPAYIVDAACASGLIAVDNAARELASGRCDMMLVGATHVQTPPQLFIQFCQISALSRDRIRPFQKGSEGTLLGEGCGVLVLKRLADAERDNDRIYAVIKGIGTASDGKAKGLLAPRPEGEVLALRRAYESSGIDPLTVDLIEAHGTGTSVGDKTEIESLSKIFGARGNRPQIAISAVKSMIGHCLPGTGAASMIKTALALHHKVLPPMLCDEPDPDLNFERTPFYINNQTRPWVHGAATPRRAGVNAFGFGGINAHVILEEYTPPENKASVSVPVYKPPRSSEVFLLSAETHAQLVALVRAAVAHLKSPNPPTLEELCYSAASAGAGIAHRLAVTAESEAELLKKLEQTLEKLSAPGAKPFKTRGGVWYGAGPAAGKLCILFPGEGSQYPGMLDDVCVHFPQVRDWFDFIEENALARGARSRAEALFPAPTGLTEDQRKHLESALYDMDMAAESVFAASLGLQGLFDDLGLHADAMLGHSTGENTALTACRVRRYEQREEVAEAVQAINAIYRKLESEGRIVHGSLLTVGGLTPQLRKQVLASSGVMQLAMDNCPNQIVLFGPSANAARLKALLTAEGAICQELPFGRAYHTPLFKPLADAFREYFRRLDFGPGRVPLYSARSCAPFPQDSDGIRELTAQQWENPVRFTETVQRLYADGFRLFLEVGPSANLTSFVGDTLRVHDDVLAVSANSRRKPGLSHLHQTLAQLFAAGARFEPKRLYGHRDIAAFDLLSDPRPTKKAANKSALSMPGVTLPEKWKRPLPVAAQGPASIAAPGAVAPAVAPAAASSDPRMTALQTHFTLMQEFLDSQARVLGLTSGNVGTVTSPMAVPVAAAPTPDAERYPLLGPVVESTVERLVMERTYDLETDLVIRDHCIGGVPSERDASLLAIPVIPFTFSMEIIAEAAHKLIAREDLVVSCVENARGSRWLSFDVGIVKLRIVAERVQAPAAEPHVACRLFRLDQGGPPGGLLVFEGQVVLTSAYPAPAAAAPWSSDDANQPIRTPDDRLYKNGMFHGPRLHGCRHFRRWGQNSIEVDAVVLPTHDYFSFTQTPRFQFDPALLDAAGQIACYWLDEAHQGGINCFPFRVAKLRIFGPPPAAGTPILVRGDIRISGETTLAARWDMIGPDGQALMVAEGWDDRLFRVDDRYYKFRVNPPQTFMSEPWLDGQLPPGFFARRMQPFTPDLLNEGGGLWGRGLAHMMLSRAERVQFYALPANGPRREEWLMGRAAAKEAARDWFRYKYQVALASADIEIQNDAHGRPRIHCAALERQPMPSVSISHSALWAVAVVTDPGLAVGLDYQRLERMPGEDLITGGFGDEERRFIDAAQAGERHLLATALWCAKEAAAKAAGRGFEGKPLEWVIIASSLDPRTVSFGSARVRHGTREYDVAIQFEGRSAISALCLTPAADGLTVAST